ncbi:MAG: exo-alpha-sialidase [Planctomycetes bacterium]|nr:exo-alpha-sialidase [Planctomycetota bacterium]
MIRTLILLLALAPAAPRATVIAGDSIQPHLAASEDGSFYAVFIKNGNIGFSSSTDMGKTWSAPVVAIDAKGKAKGGMQRGPRIAVDGKKTIYVSAPLCFDEAEFSKKYPTQDLYLAVSTDGGQTFSKPLQVNDAPKKAPESLHWLVAAPNGEVFVAWLDLRNREKGQDLAWVKITEQGKKVGKNQLIPGPLCECCAPGLAVDAKGNPTLIYREGGKNANRALMMAVSTNAGASFSKISRINQGESKVDS